jgi:hypothetical protein
VSARAWLESARDDARSWADGRSPWLRAPLLAYLAYAGGRHLASAEYRSWFAGITLAFHEMGHIVFSPLGRTLMFLGGSILQLLIPLAAALYLLLRQRDWFGLSVGLSWLATSLFELAVYVDDANRGNLALVGFSDQPEHDWDVLLTQWHVLNHAQTFAAVIKGAGALTWGAALWLGAWLILEMWRAQDAPRPAR